MRVQIRKEEGEKGNRQGGIARWVAVERTRGVEREKIEVGAGRNKKKKKKSGLEIRKRHK